MLTSGEQLSIRSQSTDKIAVTGFLQKLLSAGIIPAVPLVDMDGADLLGFKEIRDEVKFARVQVKGRAFTKAGSSTNIKINKAYVYGSFVCLLNVTSRIDLIFVEKYYCFFANEIKNGLWQLKDEDYVLAVKESSFVSDLELYEFKESKIKSLLGFLEGIDGAKEIHGIIGKLEVAMPPLEVVFSASSSL